MTGFLGVEGDRFLLPAELPLKKLTVKVAGLQTDRQFITPVLRRAPRLAAFHAEGVRLPTGSSQSQLLATLSGTHHVTRADEVGWILQDHNSDSVVLFVCPLIFKDGGILAFILMDFCT